MGLHISWNEPVFQDMAVNTGTSLVHEYCSKIKANAGEGFYYKTRVQRDNKGGRLRPNGIVFTGSYQAIKINQRENTLFNAMIAAGG